MYEEIVAEIERRQKEIEWSIRIGDKKNQKSGGNRLSELKRLLDFIKARQEQPVERKSNPLFDKYVENCDPAVMKEVNDNVDKILGRQPSEDLEGEVKRYWNAHALDYRIGRVADIDFLQLTACHFAQWQKEQDARDMYRSDNRNFKKMYDLGKKDMREQMMKDAVVGVYDVGDWGTPCICLDEPLADKQRFDKVKIIIIKEE